MFRKAVLIGLLAAGVAHAASPEIRLYQENDQVDPREVARILSAPSPAAQDAPGAPRATRSIRMLDEPPPRPSNYPAPTSARQRDPQPPSQPSRVASTAPVSDAAVPIQASALALPIQFAFDSAEILPSARRQLDALAQGVRLLDAGRRVTIEGHTDAQGSESYNMELSRRRAVAVKRYLVTVHGIQESRLNAVGMGETRPFDEQDPNASENRRVQFRGG